MPRFASRHVSLAILSGLAGLALAIAGSPGARATDRTCECRLPGGRSAPLGDRACLRAPHGGWRVTVCDMALNNTSWRFTEETCAPVQRSDDAPPLPPKTPRLSGAML